MKYISAVLIIFFWGVFTIMFSISILGLLIVADEGWGHLVDRQFAILSGKKYRDMN